MNLPLVDLRAPAAEVAAVIDHAFTTAGFCYLAGHGVDPALADAVDGAARRFFALPDSAKEPVAMAHGGRAWRGWFPLGGELTDGIPDGKEGFYFGAEQPPGDRPLHGPNLFPADPPELRPAVLAWLDAMTDLGHRLAAALGIDARLTADPTVLFRIFRYPPTVGGRWGVAEHTDYGLLTILHQDALGGLEVRGPDGWIEAPPVEGTFVVNIGDWLAATTAGRYRSTAHRVRNTTGGERISLAFFFDPSWEARVDAMPGTYGDYLLAKVSKVFPALADGVLDQDRA